MEHLVIHKSNSSQLSVSYSANILVLTLKVFENFGNCNKIYQIQLFNNHLPKWIEKNLGSVEKLYQILQNKNKYQISEKNGIIRFYLEQDDQNNQLKGAYLLKLDLKQSENKKQEIQSSFISHIQNNNSLGHQILIVNQKMPNNKHQKQQKPQIMVNEANYQENFSSNFGFKKRNCKQYDKQISQEIKNKQGFSPFQITKSQFAQINHNKQLDKPEYLQNQRMKILEQSSKYKHLEQSSQSLQASGRTLRSRKIIQSKTQSNASYSNYLKSQQRKYTNKPGKQSQLIKNLKRQNKQAKQQVNRLTIQMQHMKKIIEQLNVIINLQKTQIQGQNVKIQQINEYFQRNQEENQQVRSFSNSQRKQSLYKEWVINKHSRNIQNFSVSGLKVTYTGKNNSTWSYLFLQNIVSKRHQFNLTVYIAKCLQQNIGFGIAFHKRAYEDACWNQRQCIQYIGFSKMVFQGGRMKAISGLGIWEDTEIRLNVNIQSGSVKWYSQRGVQAEYLSSKLRKSRNSFVPFLRFKDTGDSIQILGSP